MPTLSVSADHGQLAEIRKFVAQEGRYQGLDDKAIRELQLVVDEACTNIVEHAYGEQGGEIELTIESTEDGVRVVLRDWGASFDPDAISAPDVTAPLEQRRLGGMGLFIMRQLMNKVSFDFDEKNGNTLTMVKRH